jgi:polyhydroxyalkanoate synthesis regulator phasin
MHRTTRRWVTGAAAVTAGALLIGPVAASAQSDDPGGSTTTTAPATTAPAKPKDAATWVKDVLDNLVKAGTITRAQADAVTKALQDARPMFQQGPGRRGGPWGHLGVGLALDAAAKALGITVDELRTELQSGTTISELAKAHGIDVQKVIDTLVAEARTKLDAAVKAGKLTQEQADARLQQVTDRLNKVVDEKLPAIGKGGWDHGTRHRARPDDGAGTTPSTPSTTPAPTTTGG